MEGGKLLKSQLFPVVHGEEELWMQPFKNPYEKICCCLFLCMQVLVLKNRQNPKNYMPRDLIFPKTAHNLKTFP